MSRSNSVFPSGSFIIGYTNCGVILKNKMSPDNSNIPLNPKPALTGNASNPSPRNDSEPNSDQLINKKGEKYLREGGNIEDLPDAEENIQQARPADASRTRNSQ
jgi:hypothetical protein